MDHVLTAAVGQVLITPEERIGLGGFDSSVNIAHPPEDVLDDLYARILVLDDGERRTLMVSVDCVRTNEELGRVCDSSGRPGRYGQFIEVFPFGTRRSFAEAAGTDESCVMVSATHTHSAPSHFSDKYVRRIRYKIQELVRDLVPVQLSVAVGTSGISAYRRPTLYPNPDVPIDQTLYVLCLETADGRPLASVVNYAVHPTILHPSEVQLADRVSSECVGLAMSELEAHIGSDFVSLFTQGFSGDVAPILPGIGTTEDSYPNVQKASHQLFLDIVRTLYNKQRLESGPLRIARRNVSIPTRQGFYRPSVDVTVAGVSIGPLAILFVPGEIFNGYVEKIRALSPFQYTIPVSQTNGYPGYLPTADAFTDGQGGYELLVTPFDERVEEHFTRTAAQVLADLFRGEEMRT